MHPPRLTPADRPFVEAAARAREVAALGPRFHNLDLDGVSTAPDHFLGDYPRRFFSVFSGALPETLAGGSVLDIGCEAGFFSFEMWRRGAAAVLGIDADPHYLAQARYAADGLGAPVQFDQCSVSDVGQLGRRVDLVLVTGVRYHLCHPLLALGLLPHQAVGRLLLFQTMMRREEVVAEVGPDYPFEVRDVFREEGDPTLHLVEHRYAHDPTNWWVPNRACTEAMLRSAGFRIVAHPDTEVYLCAPDADAELPELPRACAASAQ